MSDLAPKRRVQAFKCGRQVTVSAWCTVCDWTEEGETTDADPAAGSRTSRHARRHCEQTGHETRCDHTSQRGFHVLRPWTGDPDV